MIISILSDVCLLGLAGNQWCVNHELLYLTAWNFAVWCFFRFKIFSSTFFLSVILVVKLAFYFYIFFDVATFTSWWLEEEDGPSPLRDKNVFPQTLTKTQTLNVFRRCWKYGIKKIKWISHLLSSSLWAVTDFLGIVSNSKILVYYLEPDSDRTEAWKTT